jgi:hypothetical protein
MNAVWYEQFGKPCLIRNLHSNACVGSSGSQIPESNVSISPGLGFLPSVHQYVELNLFIGHWLKM